MGIERDVATDAVTVYVGDFDVLMGTTYTKTGITRVWFAPKPADCTLERRRVYDTPPGFQPPADAAVLVYFLRKEDLDGFIELLAQTRDKAFPREPDPKPEESP